MTLLKGIAIWGAVGSVASVVLGSLIRMGMTSEPREEAVAQEDTSSPEHAIAAF